MPTVTDRIRSLIDGTGLSQREFATQVGLDNSKMSKSLSGVRRFSSLDLARIAELGGVTIDWLLSGASSQLGVAARVSANGSGAAAITTARRLGEIRADVAPLGYPQDWRPVPYTQTANYEAAGAALADAATQQVRSRGLDAHAPDLAEVIEECFGADVAVGDLGENFDGLSVITDDAHLILVSRSRVPWRQRFTMAHELGHLLAGDDQGLHVDADIFDRAHGRLDSERRANAFATQFLMPTDVLTNTIGSGAVSDELFARLSSTLRVSPSALAFRLQRLRLIDSYACDAFRRLTAQDVARIAGAADKLVTDLATAQRARPPGPLARDTLAAYLSGKTTIRLYADVTGAAPDDLRAALESDGSPGTES